MDLGFLPQEVYAAIANLNINYLSEIRLRRGQPVRVEYRGEYLYLKAGGAGRERAGTLVCGDVAAILNRAMGGCVYSFAEQLRQGFITVEGGVRIGVAGEYVADGGNIKTIARPTSLNIRIPHDVRGCADGIYSALFAEELASTLIFSKPGYGKTTMLRDLAVSISQRRACNVLVLDSRNEICGSGTLGETVDVVRSCDKLAALGSAMRAMKPDVIITDELYGSDDMLAVGFARECGLCVIASSHVCDRRKLAAMPFDYFVGLRGIGRGADIYDKDFNTVCHCGPDDLRGDIAFGGKEKEGGGVRRTV